MKPENQSEVAWALGIPRKALLENWVQTLNYVRNLCAHHNRLYRRTLVIKPGQRPMSHVQELAHIRSMSPELADKLYPVLCIVLFLMDQVAPSSQWSQTFLALIEDFPHEIDASLANYGFPDNWSAMDIWSRG